MLPERIWKVDIYLDPTVHSFSYPQYILDGEGIAYMQFSHSQSSQTSPASYPITARSAFLGQLPTNFILLQPFYQNQILVLQPLQCKVVYETVPEYRKHTSLTIMRKTCFPDFLKRALYFSQRRGTDHASTAMSIQQASYSLQIRLPYVVLNDVYKDHKVNAVVPKCISNSTAKLFNPNIFIFQSMPAFNSLTI